MSATCIVESCERKTYAYSRWCSAHRKRRELGMPMDTPIRKWRRREALVVKAPVARPPPNPVRGTHFVPYVPELWWAGCPMLDCAVEMADAEAEITEASQGRAA